MARTAETLTGSVVIASVIPSAKESAGASPETLRHGSTASDRTGTVATADCFTHRRATVTPTATSSGTTDHA
ncbi:hypothetical protein LuPra_01089 [Luteitalea pratensis]|uniref:Uncharacterized protein n=1 Tax=Luteitalea pratensis TaxID=1855912 RepID=A0A143PHL2_LUTPR|nr:hypothetical protein LuPra_01089 [Luteitalea pratensis]